MNAPRAAVPLYIHPVVDSALWERVLRPGAADLVGLTIAEYVPRQVIAMRRLLDALPRV